MIGNLNSQVVDGWLVVDCDASSVEEVHIAVDDEWLPAFRDTVGGRRVAKVRVPAVAPGSVVRLRLRVGAAVTEAPSIRI